MKKFIVILSVVTMLGVCACGSTTGTKVAVTKSPMPTSSATPVPTVAATEQPATPAITEYVQEEEPEEDIEEETYYIGNKNSNKFHDPDCKTLPSQKNRVSFSSYDEAINSGYSPCKNCNPF